MQSTPQSKAYPLGPALEFLERLWAVNHALERLSGSMANRLGVTVQQCTILRCLGRYPGLPAGQLAALLHVDPGTVSAALRRLEEKGLIERRRDPKDKRRTALGLTAKGRDKARLLPGTAEHAVESLIGTIPEHDLDATRRVLGRLTEVLQAEVSTP